MMMIIITAIPCRTTSEWMTPNGEEASENTPKLVAELQKYLWTRAEGVNYCCAFCMKASVRNENDLLKIVSIFNHFNLILITRLNLVFSSSCDAIRLTLFVTLRVHGVKKLGKNSAFPYVFRRRRRKMAFRLTRRKIFFTFVCAFVCSELLIDFSSIIQWGKMLCISCDAVRIISFLPEPGLLRDFLGRESLLFACQGRNSDDFEPDTFPPPPSFHKPCLSFLQESEEDPNWIDRRRSDREKVTWLKVGWLRPPILIIACPSYLPSMCPYSLTPAAHFVSLRRSVLCALLTHSVGWMCMHAHLFVSSVSQHDFSFLCLFTCGGRMLFYSRLALVCN